MQLHYKIFYYINLLLLMLFQPMQSAQIESKEPKKEMAVLSPACTYNHVGKYLSCRHKGVAALEKFRHELHKNPDRANRGLIDALHQENKEAMQFYGQAMNIWPVYINALEKGRANHVAMLFSLLIHEKTTVDDQTTAHSDELPLSDCSGLEAVIETKSLDDEDKQKLLDKIIAFYKPTRLVCQKLCCYFSCDFLCQERREALIAYGLAKAGERCIELELSDQLFNHIYKNHKAFITQEALILLHKANRLYEAEDFMQKRIIQLRQEQGPYNVLFRFGCIALRRNDSSAYHKQVAQPVITGKKPGYYTWNPWSPLCPKE